MFETTSDNHRKDSVYVHTVYVHINLRIPEIQLMSIIVSGPHTVHLVRKQTR